MARSLGLYVVAEGVETEAQLNYVRSHECTNIESEATSVAEEGVVKLNRLLCGSISFPINAQYTIFRVLPTKRAKQLPHCQF